jgi:hypothetical protein
MRKRLKQTQQRGAEARESILKERKCTDTGTLLCDTATHKTTFGVEAEI